MEIDNVIATLNRLAKYAAGEQPIGCGDPLLASINESWAPYCRFLHNVVEEFKPEAVIECGVHRATTTAHMALANPDTLVIGIDHNYHPDAAVVAGNYSNIVLLTGDTTDYAMYYHVHHELRTEIRNAGSFEIGGFGEPLKVGLIFLDSTHDGDTPRKEFELYRPLFGDVCIVAVDDLYGPQRQMEKMQEFWEWLPGEKLELHYLHPVPETHIGIIDMPGFGVSVVTKGD